jgi:hypothetical protein
LDRFLRRSSVLNSILTKRIILSAYSFYLGYVSERIVAMVNSLNAARSSARNPARNPAHKRTPHQHGRKRTYTLQSATPAPPQFPTGDQIQRLRVIVATYAPDLGDPAAIEVLLVLLEVCRIFDPAEQTLSSIFWPRLLERLDNWGDCAPERRRPAQVQRVWVWLPNQQTPRLLPIGEDGMIWAYAGE